MSEEEIRNVESYINNKQTNVDAKEKELKQIDAEIAAELAQIGPFYAVDDSRLYSNRFDQGLYAKREWIIGQIKREQSKATKVKGDLTRYLHHKATKGSSISIEESTDKRRLVYLEIFIRGLHRACHDRDMYSANVSTIEEKQNLFDVRWEHRNAIQNYLSSFKRSNVTIFDLGGYIRKIEKDEINKVHNVIYRELQIIEQAMEGLDAKRNHKEIQMCYNQMKNLIRDEFTKDIYPTWVIDCINECQERYNKTLNNPF